MFRIDDHRYTDVALAWWVAIAVGVAGIYDFFQGQAPKGVVNLGADTALVIFLAACAVTAALATLTGVVASRRCCLDRCLLGCCPDQCFGATACR